MKISKVVIPAAVADEIEDSRKFGCTNDDILEDVVNVHVTDRETEILRSIPLNMLVSALINGYEREQSPKTGDDRYTRIKETYHRRLNNARYSGHIHESMRHNSFADGMKYVLNEIGVVVDGINNVKTEV